MQAALADEPHGEGSSSSSASASASQEQAPSEGSVHSLEGNAVSDPEANAATAGDQLLPLQTPGIIYIAIYMHVEVVKGSAVQGICCTSGMLVSLDGISGRHVLCLSSMLM